jgi:hypothetical protein
VCCLRYNLNDQKVLLCSVQPPHCRQDGIGPGGPAGTATLGPVKSSFKFAARLLNDVLYCADALDLPHPTSSSAIMTTSSGSIARLLVLGIVFHLVYIGTVFDCYFTSPVVHGMRQFKLPQAQAKRLVLIVGACEPKPFAKFIGR